MCVHMCIQVCGYVHACAYVVVSARERKSERESVCEIVFYVSQLAYTQRGVWKRSCACKCIDKQDHNKTYQHTVSLFLRMCLWVCKRQRQTERQPAKECMRVVSLSLHIICKYIYTHSWSPKLLSIANRQMHVCHAHVGCMHAHAFYPEAYPLSLCLSLPPSFSFQVY